MFTGSRERSNVAGWRREAEFLGIDAHDKSLSAVGGPSVDLDIPAALGVDVRHRRLSEDVVATTPVDPFHRRVARDLSVANLAPFGV